MKICAFETNKKNCNCTYPCSKKGICCECIQYHRRRGEMPACYFPAHDEATYDRTIDNFIQIYKEKGMDFLVNS
jgi:hypothetical protein